MSTVAPYRAPHDCAPTLSDLDVVDFCRNGYLMLPAVVPDEINRKVVNYLEQVDSTFEPTPIMQEPWFVKGVLCNPQAAGAVRSLLGANFLLPAIISNHRSEVPKERQGWHRDGGSRYLTELEYLQVFYYPEACPAELGPTDILPGSHFLRTKATMMAHYGKIAGTVSTASPAGTIFLTVYSIWHRRSHATVSQTGTRSIFRNLLKYSYWRTVAPIRDWLIDSDFDFSTATFTPPGDHLFEQFQGAIAAARLFAWLCGENGEYDFRGGQNWPVSATVRDGVDAPGVPPSLSTNS
jgi:hypothetical protein